MNSAACRPSGKFAAKSEAFQDQVVRMGLSRKDKEGWFFHNILVKEAWTQSRNFLYVGVSFPKSRTLSKS